MSKSAFERYAPFIQEYIYRKKWTDLREVQVEACENTFLSISDAIATTLCLIQLRIEPSICSLFLTLQITSITIPHCGVPQ